MTHRLAVIGGSGLDCLDGLIEQRREPLSTPYGATSGPVVHGRYDGTEILFLPRHGSDHTIPPHTVNYRANLWALRESGVDRVIAVAAVGAIDPGLRPGDLAVPDQILDYTYGRAHTFVQGTPGEAVTHVDFSEPYCAALRRILIAAARRSSNPVPARCTYAATQGPRFESAAEIDRLERDGAGVVGMTGMPEAGLARELGLCYASLVVVSNAAAGRGVGDISLEQIHVVLDEGMGKVRQILKLAVVDASNQSS